MWQSAAGRSPHCVCRSIRHSVEHLLVIASPRTCPLSRHAAGFDHDNQARVNSMLTASEQLAELKRELADLAKQTERLAGRAREISDRLQRE